MTRDSRSDATDDRVSTTEDTPRTDAPANDEGPRTEATADPAGPRTDGAGPTRSGETGGDGFQRIALDDGEVPDVVAGTRVEERTAVAEEDHIEGHERFDGIAVVGVTDDDGRVLTMVEADDHAILPHGPVEPGEDFAAVARRTVEEQLDVPVALDAVLRARRIEYRLATDDDSENAPAGEDSTSSVGRTSVDDPSRDESRRATTHQVVFEASLAGDVDRDDVESQRGCWTARWTDEVPDNPGWDREDIRGDVRALLEVADRPAEPPTDDR